MKGAGAGDSKDVRGLLAWGKTRLVVVLAVAAVVAAVPLVTSSAYLITLVVLVLIYAVLNQSWNLTIGMLGIWNFGQLALFAIGAYTYGILTTQLSAPPFAALVAGALAAGLAAIFLMLPALHLRGIYACLLTFAFAEVFRLVVINDDTGLTGGPFGLAGIDGLFDGLSYRMQQAAYLWAGLIACVAVALLIQRLIRSPFGLALQTLTDSTPYSIGMGVNRSVHILLASALSGFLAGVAGGLYAGFYHSFSPLLMGLGPMGLFVMMIVIGGLGRVSGPIVGTAVVVAITELMRDTGQWRIVASGAVFLIILAFWPSGLSGLMQKGFAYLGRWMREDEGPPEAQSKAESAGLGSTPSSVNESSTEGRGVGVD